MSLRRFIIGSLGAIITGSVLTLALIRAGALEFVFTRGNYYLLAGTLSLAGAAAYQAFVSRQRTSFSDDFYSWVAPVLVGLLFCTLLFGAVGTHFRVLSDETNLLSASLSLHSTGNFYNIVEAAYLFDSLHIIRQVVPHRPGLLAFLTALVHAVRGFSPQNIFVVNFIAAALTFSCIVWLGRTIRDATYGWLAAFLLVSFPVFGLSATSAGFDTLNLLLISVVLLLLAQFLQNPSINSARLLILSTVLASHCRYESALLCLPVAMALLLRRKNLTGPGRRWDLTLYPLLFLPALWQRLLSGTIANVGDNESTALDFQHLRTNLPAALEFFFDPWGKQFPTAAAVVVLSLIGAGMLALFLIKRRSNLGFRGPFLVLGGTGILVLVGVHMLYYFGDLRQPWVMRLANIYLPALALLAAIPLRWLFSRRAGPVIIVAGIFLNLFVQLPKVQLNHYGVKLTIYREYRENLRVIEQRPPNVLVICAQPGQYAARNRSAISFKFASENAARLTRELGQGIFPSAVAIQTIRYKDGQAKHILPPQFQLRSIYEYPISDEYFNRISTVTVRPQP